jgi:hypothetical protein
MAGYGVGATLLSQGQGQQQQAVQEMGEAAQQEQQRNVFNQQQEVSRKAGNAQLGATAGALVGSALGPLGSMIGGVLGGVASKLF